MICTKQPISFWFLGKSICFTFSIEETISSHQVDSNEGILTSPKIDEQLLIVNLSIHIISHNHCHKPAASGTTL